MADPQGIAESRAHIPEENLQQALALCHELTNEHGRQLLQVMFEVGAQKLLEKAAEAPGEEARSYREAMRALDSASAKVIDNYSLRFNTVFEDQGGESAAPKGDFSMGLSLVDEEALEQEILVKRMASKAATETQSQFSKLNRRFCFLRNRRIKPADNPLSPQSQGFCMTQAMESLDIPEGAKLVLLAALEQEFANALGYLYAELNEFLIDLDILPEIKHHVWRAESSAKARVRANLTESQRKALEDLHRPEAEELQEILDSFAGSAQGPGTAAGTLEAGEFRQQAESVVQLIRDLPQGEPVPSGALLERLDQAADQSGAAKPSGTTRQIVQQADELVASLAGEFPADSRAAYLAGKASAPLARLAVEDPSILVNEDHPLRQSVRELTAYGEYTAVADKRVQSELLDEFEDLIQGLDLLDFQEPETIANFTADVSQRTAVLRGAIKDQVLRLAKLEEGRTGLVKAQREIDDLLKKALTGNRMPAQTLNFLLGKWRNIMVHCYLGSEQDPGSWQAARNATDRMVSLIPQVEQGVPEKKQSEFSDLIKNVWNQLVKHTGYRGAPSDLLSELGLSEKSTSDSEQKNEGMALLMGASETGWREVSADDPLFRSSANGSAARLAQSEKAYQLWKDRLKPGTWVEMAEGDEHTRCRLMKVFGSGERCVFVDGLGRMVRVMSALEVLEQVKKGKLKKTA